MISFRSQITKDVLGYFFINPRAENYVNELARILNSDAGNLFRKLKELEKEGILDSEQKGNQKYFFINKKYPFLKEVKKIFDAEFGLEKNIYNVLKKIKGLKEAYVFGSYAKGGFGEDSDIDLLLVGQHSFHDVHDVIYPLQKKIKREINMINFDEKEFNKKKKEGDDFLKNIFEGKYIKII